MIDIRLVMATALGCLATTIIVCHNHPSGNLKPSSADEKITEQLVNAGKTLRISVLDHIIITSENGYFSFAENGLI